MSSARYEIYEDEAGEWRWRLIAANGEIVGVSSEPYRDSTDAGRAIADAAAASAEASKFQYGEATYRVTTKEG